tara:strand:+ start:205 stop:423 length:219 start_codon:yes stop_codon:yes gene_type:complete
LRYGDLVAMVTVPVLVIVAIITLVLVVVTTIVKLLVFKVVGNTPFVLVAFIVAALESVKVATDVLLTSMDVI